ncbi:MAG: restriction endonuclease subunit S, partial [Gammaproteobacteria bacterium]|nr:restriction endonuclease subunit S [Gammaproteobacteria bacterium]
MKHPRIQDIAGVFHGGTPRKQTPEHWIGDIPWVSPKDMKADSLSDAADHISKQAIENSATRLVPAGSILAVARSGVLAHSFPVTIIEKPMAFNQDIKALVPNRELVIPEFLFYFLRYRENEVVSRGVKKGATVHSLQSAYLENLEVPLPSLCEQQRIVDILKRADGIRRLRRQAQETVQQLIPALFVDMFGDPATNSKRWPETTIGEAIKSADYGSSTKASDDGAGLPLIRMGNVDYSGRLDLTELKYVQLPNDQIAKYRLSEGDIL